MNWALIDLSEVVSIEYPFSYDNIMIVEIQMHDETRYVLYDMDAKYFIETLTSFLWGKDEQAIN